MIRYYQADVRNVLGKLSKKIARPKHNGEGIRNLTSFRPADKKRRRRRPWIVWAITMVTLSSGLVNVFSVPVPTLPGAKRDLLIRLFPLEFLHLSRIFTLLIGFALVISSINIYKRKQRAFRIVLVLSPFSILFHLTKGLNYGEAILSLFLVILLWIARENFTVKSESREKLSALFRFAVAVTITVAYGVAGFSWFDRSGFGFLFTLQDSLHATLRYLLLIGDPGLTPLTQQAQWFLDSLYAIAATTLLYSGFALFRPVIYHFRTLPQERSLAMQLVNRFGRSQLDFFKCWPDKSFFFPYRDCFIAYRVAANYAIALADPIGPESKIEGAITEFERYCDDNDWRTSFYQTLPDFLDIYSQIGFKKLKIGDAAIVDLKSFPQGDRKLRKIRRKNEQLEKAGLHVRIEDPPIQDSIMKEIREVSDEWLQIPGRRERGFSLGRFDPDYLRSTPLFLVLDQSDRIASFANIVPSYCKGETTIDLMRHRIEAPNGSMDYLLTELFIRSRELGYQRFNLGMAPMSGFRENEEASIEERAVQYFFQHLNFLFSYSGMLHYKRKFATSWEPRYLIYRRHLDLPRIAVALSRLSGLKT